MWESFTQVLSMGKYTWYVWSAYGVAIIMILLHIRSARLQRQKLTAAIERWFKG